MTDDFNPAQRAIKIQGGTLYLQVKDRLIWARRDHPDLSVETEVVQLTDKIAVFKAVVSFAEQFPIANIQEIVYVKGTGHGSETPQGFPPGYIEKAETIAIGRALAAIGYGTAAAFEEEPGSKIADAPVSQPGRPQPRDTPPSPVRVIQGSAVDPDDDATPEQLADIGALMRALNMTPPHRKNFAKKHVGVETTEGLTYAQAGTLIRELQKKQDADVQPPMPLDVPVGGPSAHFA